MSVIDRETGPAAEIATLAYARAEPAAPTLWPLLVVGGVHGLACVSFAAWQGRQWLVGTFDRFDEYESPTVIFAGLAGHVMLGVAVAAACAATLLRPSTGMRRTTRAIAAMQGGWWFVYGMMESLALVARVNSPQRGTYSVAEAVVLIGIREVNQGLVPLLLVIALARTAGPGRAARATIVAMLFACFSRLVPYAFDLASRGAEYFITNAPKLWQSWLSVGLVQVAAVLLIVARGRAFRSAAAMPLAVFLAFRIVSEVRYPSNVRDLDSLLSAASGWGFFALNRDVALVTFLLFTVAAAPRPRWSRRAYDAATT